MFKGLKNIHLCFFVEFLFSTQPSQKNIAFISGKSNFPMSSCAIFCKPRVLPKSFLKRLPPNLFLFYRKGLPESSKDEIRATVLCRSRSADQQALLSSQPLSVDVVLLQFFVARVPEVSQDALHVEGVHRVRGHHASMNL